jgi:hypothetical protein
MRLFLLACLPAFFVGCGQSSKDSVDDPQEQVAVREVLERYYRDFNSRDWAALAGHFWFDAEIATVWRVPGEDSDRVVRTSIDEFFGDAPRENPFHEDFDTWMVSSNVSVYENLAQAWVWYGARLNTAGELAEWDGVDAFTLLKHDDVWKIAALMFASSEE